jgi:DNA-binding Lrp family transcriptional regulator
LRASAHGSGPLVEDLKVTSKQRFVNDLKAALNAAWPRLSADRKKLNPTFLAIVKAGFKAERIDAVGLSASPCLQRVKRLESAGYITAQINLAKLIESITVFTEITPVDHRKEDFVKFEANMRNVDELMECHLVSGGYDYLLRFICRNINHYRERMENLLERNIGIEKYFSYIVLKSPIVKNVLPLETLLDPQAQ